MYVNEGRNLSRKTSLECNELGKPPGKSQALKTFDPQYIGGNARESNNYLWVKKPPRT